MRIKIILTVIALLTMVGRAYADNLSVGSVKMGPGETKQLEISLVNPDKQYTAFQFDLQLPEGISIAKNDKGKLVASLNDSRKDDHSFAVSALANNTYRFLAYSLSNAVFSGTSGVLISVSISSDQALEDGVKEATLKAQVFTDAAGDQYNWEDVTFDITIATPPVPVITADNKSREYGEDNPVFTYTANAEFTGVPELTCEASKTSSVGTYDILVNRGTVEGNYIGVNGILTIIAKTVDNPTIILSETSYTYDGTAKRPTVTVKDGTMVIPATEYTVSYSNNINVGTATVTITDVEGGNYKVSGSATFTISSAEGALTPPTGKTDLVYNGTAQDLITAGSTTTGTMEYSLDGTTYSTSIPQGTNAGSYTVYYRVKGDANHNDVAAQSFSVGIAKATLSVSVGNYEITEGERVPEFTISYDGFVNNETVNVLTKAPVASCSATSESKTGEYPITISGGEATNYTFDYKSGTLTIKENDTFVAGGDDNKEDEVTYKITTQEGDATPTVAIIDDRNVSGEFTIPETVEHNGITYKVTKIGESAFEGNISLTKVTIPSSVTEIGDDAFKGCSYLESITTYNETPIDLSGSSGARGMMTRTDGSSIFEGVNKATCILYVPEGSVELYKVAPVWSEFQNILAIGSSGIYGIIKNSEPQDIYDLQGHKVRAKATSLEGLPRGIYIINGKKTILK